MKYFIGVIFVLLLALPLQGATIYKWVDKSGAVSFTDDYEKVPPAYRDQIKKEVTEDHPQVGIGFPSEASTQRKEETKTDLHGLDEGYWRDRARRWNEQLKEATANYEEANNKIIEKSETLPMYWRYTQNKVNMIELERLKEERSKYKAQIDEANNMLNKLSKEAEEFGANPDWLK